MIHIFLYERRTPRTPEDAPDLLRSAGNVEDRIYDEWPDIGQLFNACMSMLIPLVGEYYKSGASEARDILFTQSVSDYITVLQELVTGSGRSASRTARTLIESAINIRYVVQNPAIAGRYTDHLDLAPKYENDFAASFIWPERRRGEKIRKSASHAYKKVASRISDLLNRKYAGQRFEATWIQVNLKDRATRVNLDYLYDAYKLLSLVAHGSAPAVLGLTRKIDDTKVIRSGPDLSLCPVAYLASFKAFEEILQTVASYRPNLDVTPAVDMIGEALKVWSVYREAVRRADNKIWPVEAPYSTGAILGITMSGARRWYWFDPGLNVLIEADTPVLTEEQEGQVSQIQAKINAHPGRFFVGATQFVTVVMEAVSVTPKRGGKILPPTALLIRPDEVVGEGSGI